MWCVPVLDDEYINRMGEIVALYEKPYDARLPVVCLDEKLCELREQVRPSRRHRGMVFRDYEYQRKGTANLYMMTEPKGGRHFVRVTKRRTASDFAKCLRWLAQRYPDAITIHLVVDNLNVHCEKSLVNTFGVRQGRRLWARFTVHYTPKHGSWLNCAELALSITSRMCLGRERIATIDQLRCRTRDFWKKRRSRRWTMQWRWTTAHMQEWLKSNGTGH